MKISKGAMDKQFSANLAKDIMQLLVQQKLVVLLIGLNVVSALLVVQFAHLNRLAIIEQEVLLQQRDELDVYWRHLILEQRTLTEHSRVEALVEEHLGLFRPKLGDEVVVKIK